MSDQIKHECGIALIRLLKPLSYYQQKYGTPLYGISKLQLLMQKQRNRGQDGAGIATIKLDPAPGTRYISRRRSNADDSIKEVFASVFDHFNKLTKEQMSDTQWLKENIAYTGELLLGHLRYGTHGGNTIEHVHPFLRQNNWISRNLVMAGNFNLTNVDELFSELVALGQYPKEKSDTVTIMEKIGHFLDDEVQRLFNWFNPDGYTNQQISELIMEHLDVQRILRRASKQFDGGYALAGLIGHGDGFVMRDPWGIRPAYYYHDDEVVVVASERPAIQTAFDVQYPYIKELQRGHALIIKKSGKVVESPFIEQREQLSCSFERIYFSRGTDREIYSERKALGELLALPVLQMLDFNIDDTVFSFIPNTAEVAFLGLTKGLEKIVNQRKQEQILKLGKNITQEAVSAILDHQPRIEKMVVKDAKLRTFIADDQARGEMVAHIYDVTYGIVRNHIDTLVLLDDSIVRGTTLRDSIISIVARLKPKKIIILSSAPQIRYPDCYGIDMSRIGEFVAFQALVALLKQDGKEQLLYDAYERCKQQENAPPETVKNELQSLYALYNAEKISEKIATIITPPDIEPTVHVIYQSIEALHTACPKHRGDWYFTGDYPTMGGNRVANRAFINYIEKNNKRPYD